MSGFKRLLGLISFVALLPALAPAASVSVDAMSEGPQSWAAPPYWSPPSSNADSDGRAGLAVGRQSLATSPAPLPFVAVAPCRVIDTRGNGFVSPWGAPPLLGFQNERTFPVVGQCGIPADARAVSFNFAVVNPSALGDLRVFPAGSVAPLVSTLN